MNLMLEHTDLNKHPDLNKKNETKIKFESCSILKENVCDNMQNKMVKIFT